ncbi:MAG: radical SAM protein, partial [Candidatus Hadarchaeales archaeon]
MWRLLRPDAVAVLKDQKARRSLQRYFSVVFGELPARFLVCRRAPVRVDLSASEAELWEAHDAGLKEFRGLLAKIDSGKIALSEISEPEVSLLDVKIELARRMLESCRFCERRCGVNRRKGERGVCGVGEKSKMASEFMHHGEEPELVPSYTIFFNGCTFKCVFCQNWDISQHPEEGVEVTATGLAKLVDSARDEGARNVNWVGGEPTPNLHTILETLSKLRTSVPSVWNSNMYMSLEAMKLLFGTQDIYLADFKYGNDGCAQRLSKVSRYFEVVARNHRLAAADAEM